MIASVTKATTVTFLRLPRQPCPPSAHLLHPSLFSLPAVSLCEHQGRTQSPFSAGGQHKLYTVADSSTQLDVRAPAPRTWSERVDVAHSSKATHSPSFTLSLIHAPVPLGVAAPWD